MVENHGEINLGGDYDHPLSNSHQQGSARNVENSTMRIHRDSFLNPSAMPENNDKGVSTVSLDMTKAFDGVPHYDLQSKFRSYGTNVGFTPSQHRSCLMPSGCE